MLEKRDTERDALEKPLRESSTRRDAMLEKARAEVLRVSATKDGTIDELAARESGKLRRVERAKKEVTAGKSEFGESVRALEVAQARAKGRGLPALFRRVPPSQVCRDIAQDHARGD